MFEIRDELFVVPKLNAQLYLPGRSLILTKDPKDLTCGYCESDIILKQVEPRPLSESAQKVWDARFEKLQLASKRAGKFLGLHHPYSSVGKLGIDFFSSGFLDWKCTLPINDEYDVQLKKEDLRPPINLHHAVITADDQLLYVTRGTNRETWNHGILGLHSWGTDIDKDYACDQIIKNISQGQGVALFAQAKGGICRELNPFEQKPSDTPNVVLDEILSQKDVTINSLNCLTLHIKPYDMGYHACFTAHVNKEAGDILEKRNKYPMVGRISSYSSTPFTENNMADFFARYHERIATSIEPAIIMACVQSFGEGFIDRLPYEVVRNK